MPTLRLPRLGCCIRLERCGLTASRCSSLIPRCASPRTGCSILITSAPQSVSTAPAAGTNVNWATSSIRTPFMTWVIVRSPSRRVEADGFLVGELVQALLAVLTAIARALDPAEGRVGLHRPRPAVERDAARAQAQRHLVGLARIARPDCA